MPDIFINRLKLLLLLTSKYSCLYRAGIHQKTIKYIQMIKLTEAQIDDIAQDLDCGMKCYIHKENGEIISIPDELRGLEPDEEFWGEDMKKIEDDYKDYIEVEGMNSTEAFRVMEDFANIMDSKELSVKLINALNRRKPFQNFKDEIDYSGEYRQKWFDISLNGQLNG